MATKPLPDQATLLKLLRYEPETGKLFWRERTIDMCHDRSVMIRFNRHHAGREAFTSDDGNGYRAAMLFGFGMFKAHRVIWCMVHGFWPVALDHINQNKSDNRIGNLRLTDPIQNGRNCKLNKRNRSGRIGVNWNDRYGLWRAKIRHEGKYIELGMFDSFDEACSARASAEMKFGYSPLHGSQIQR